jgi:hypothetical protein
MDCDQQGYGRTRENIASTGPTGNGWMMQETKRTYSRPVYPKRPKWRPKARCKDDVENDIRKREIFNWRQVAQDRGK